MKIKILIGFVKTMDIVEEGFSETSALQKSHVEADPSS